MPGRERVRTSDVWPTGVVRDDVLLSWSLAAWHCAEGVLVPPYSCDISVDRLLAIDTEVSLVRHYRDHSASVEIADSSGLVARVTMALGSDSPPSAGGSSVAELVVALPPLMRSRPYTTEAARRGWLSDMSGLGQFRAVSADTFLRWTLDLLHTTVGDWGGPLHVPRLRRAQIRCINPLKMEVSGFAANVTATLEGRSAGTTLWKVVVDSYPGPWAEMTLIADLPADWVSAIERAA
jgi:hypothetical protein